MHLVSNPNPGATFSALFMLGVRRVTNPTADFGFVTFCMLTGRREPPYRGRQLLLAGDVHARERHAGPP
jgi:hypothetical protein